MARLGLLLEDTRELAAQCIFPYEWQVQAGQLEGSGSRCGECLRIWLNGKAPEHAESCRVGRILRDVAFIKANLAILSPDIPTERRHASEADGVGSPAAAEQRPQAATSLPRFAEPLSVNEPGVSGLPGSRCVMDSAGRVLFDFKHSNLCRVEQEAIALRIMACVNACVGLPDAVVSRIAEGIMPAGYDREYEQWLAEQRALPSGRHDSSFPVKPTGGAE